MDGAACWRYSVKMSHVSARRFLRWRGRPKRDQPTEGPSVRQRRHHAAKPKSNATEPPCTEAPLQLTCALPSFADLDKGILSFCKKRGEPPSCRSPRQARMTPCAHALMPSCPPAFLYSCVHVFMLAYHHVSMRKARRARGRMIWRSSREPMPGIMST